MDAPFVIDAEFQRLLPIETESADAELDAELEKAGGPRDPLVAWKGQNILLDGHRRYTLCKRHQWPYQVVEIELPDRDAARNWMIRNQLARRNVDPRSAALLRARLVDGLTAVGRPAAAAVLEVAEAAGRSERQVWRDRRLAKALDKLPPDLRGRFETGDLKDAGPDTIRELSKLDEHEQRAVVALKDSGQYGSISAAVLGITDQVTGPDNPEHYEDAEDSTDTMAVDEEPTGPKLFAVVFRHLGLLRKSLDDLGQTCPGAFYPQCKLLSDRLADKLAAWEKEAVV